MFLVTEVPGTGLSDEALPVGVPMITSTRGPPGMTLGDLLRWADPRDRAALHDRLGSPTSRNKERLVRAETGLTAHGHLFTVSVALAGAQRPCSSSRWACPRCGGSVLKGPQLALRCGDEPSMSSAAPAPDWYAGVLGSVVEFAIAVAGLAVALQLVYVAAIGVTRIMERSGRTRGSGALAGWLFVQVWVAVICASVWAAQAPLRFSEPGADSSWASGLDVAIAAVVGAGGGALFSVGLALLVPRRTRTGPVPHVLGAAGRIGKVSALVLYCSAVPATIAFAWWMDTGLVASVLVSGALLFSVVRLGAALHAGSRRMAPDEVAGTESEVVLYLRPFTSEYALFANGLNFESYLGPEIGRLAPFVALGSPTERLPPKGASRVYTGDADWQGWVDSLAGRAVCIIGTTASSSNTAWELARMAQLGFQTKLFLLTSPAGEETTNRVEPKTRSALLSFGAALWAGRKVWAQKDLREAVRSLSYVRPPSSMSPLMFPDWSDVVRTLTDCGYQVEQPFPGPGAVLTFDRHGRAMVVATGASSPREYVDAIRRRIRPG